MGGGTSSDTDVPKQLDYLRRQLEILSKQQERGMADLKKELVQGMQDLKAELARKDGGSGGGSGGKTTLWA